jgi:hypothetical protein
MDKLSLLLDSKLIAIIAIQHNKNKIQEHIAQLEVSLKILVTVLFTLKVFMIHFLVEI